MAKDIRVDAKLWEQFEHMAKERRRNPLRLLATYMRECMETWEDEKLDREIRRDLHRSGHTEADAVELVRKFRRQRRSGNGTA